MSVNSTGLMTLIIHICALRSDGTAACWADDLYGLEPPEDEVFTSIASSSTHACALRSDGTTVCWGQDRFGQASPPSGVSLAGRAPRFRPDSSQSVVVVTTRARWMPTAKPPVGGLPGGSGGSQADSYPSPAANDTPVVSAQTVASYAAEATTKDRHRRLRASGSRRSRAALLTHAACVLMAPSRVGAMR